MKFTTADSDQYDNDEEYNVYNTEEDDTDSESDIPEPGKKKNPSRKGMSKMALAILIIVLVSFFAYIMFVCPRIDECNKLVNDLQTSCNELDLLGIADCMNPTARNAIYIIAGAGIVLDDMLDQVVKLFDDDFSHIMEGSGMQLSDFFEKIKIKPIRYGFPGKSRIITCRVSFGGITQKVRMVIKKEYGEVYIDGIELIE